MDGNKLGDYIIQPYHPVHREMNIFEQFKQLVQGFIVSGFSQLGFLISVPELLSLRW